jgi:predicted nucleotide-binding protein
VFASVRDVGEAIGRDCIAHDQGDSSVDDTLDDMVRIARRCERAARAFDTDPLPAMRDRLNVAINEVSKAWSGSFIGYHANIYIQELRPRRPGEHFDSEWGGVGSHVSLSRTRGPWAEYSYEAVQDEILRRAGISDLSAMGHAAEAAGNVFDECKAEILPTLDALLAANDDSVLREVRQKIAELKNHLSRQDFAQSYIPRGQYMTRDNLAISQGMRAPPHLQLEAWALEIYSYGNMAQELANNVRYAIRYLQQRHKMKGKSVAKTDGKIFIGHGRSNAWRDLKDFIQDRLGLQWDEFNREPTAGYSTKERLESMLDEACFAFMVMTAEDEHADGSKHARENVIHEAGLFQGRLGFERAIILLEEGCAEFSNIIGITQIRFPMGNIIAKSEEVRRVLEREGILKS